MAASSLPAPGDPAPDFLLKDQNNQPVQLSDLRGRRTVLLVFYPLAFTGTCRGELAGIQAELDRYRDADVQVLTVSVDSVYTHKVFAMQEGFDFPLLADFWPHGGVARAYGVFNEAAGFADRGTFVIDRAGIVRFAERVEPGVARDRARWHAALAAVTGAGEARVGAVS
ncbi:putative peroxiredoxin (thioredoxin reductase) AhpE [Pilimelia anulata]|uniref:Alkyl hydroperoxide reductase E n=1 Tax=Pilimelia anulata TaxID=53371 RepID=A0A8J3B0M2_9ACTN|nr:peroxiredoxin [Pilimelia anulata]GGJ84141.1 putative peroxiredoxin (thioredoxin reductase) AhpE [Pilimelia anulata]